MQLHFNGQYYYFTDTELIVAAVVFIVVVLIAVGAYFQYRKAKTLALRNRFGTEYDRAVLKHGSAKKAEAEAAQKVIDDAAAAKKKADEAKEDKGQ